MQGGALVVGGARRPPIKVVPHKLDLTMLSPSSVNVLCFDPQRGADQARGYAGKYCSKPEAWYYMETEKNCLKDWLKCRTVGLCIRLRRRRLLAGAKVCTRASGSSTAQHCSRPVDATRAKLILLDFLDT